MDVSWLIWSIRFLIQQPWMPVLFLGLAGFVYVVLSMRGNTIRPRAEPIGYRILRLREKSKAWGKSAKWEKVNGVFQQAGLSLTLGEYLFFALLLLSTVELVLLMISVFLQRPGFFLVGLLLPILTGIGAFFYLQSRIDQRKRLIQADFIHCFSRLADFVHYQEITDYEKIRRSLVGTRVLHKALIEEVYYRKDPRAAILQMEKWVSFTEERLLLRNALHEALYSLPELAERSLLELAENLRKRRAARWAKELGKIKFLAMAAPYYGALVFAAIMILSMWSVIGDMMGWSK